MKRSRLSAKERTTALATDPTLRKQIFKNLLEHVEAGYSLDCFDELSSTSITSFLNDYPHEFSQESLDQSVRRGRGFWEDVGLRQATGKCLGNSRSWIYSMMNRYNWTDKCRVESEAKGSVTVSVVNYGNPNALQAG